MSVEPVYCKIHGVEEPLTCPTCGALGRSGNQLLPISDEKWQRLTAGMSRMTLTPEQEESARQAQALVEAGHVFYTCRCASMSVVKSAPS